MAIYSPGNTGNPIRMLGSRFFRPVVIINHYRLPGDAEIGSYAITGTVATVARSNARIDVGQADPTGIGSYTIIGVPSLNAYTLSLAVGVYSLTGTDAGTIHGYPLSVDSGVYALTGTDADLVQAIAESELDADSGSYAITGSGATLQTDARQGAYVLTGTDVNFLYGEVLPVDAGSYAISGQDVDLIDSGSAVNDHLLCVMGLGR